MIRSMLRCLWRRDSASFVLLIIDLAHRLSKDDVREMKDYFAALHEYNIKHRTAE